MAGIAAVGKTKANNGLHVQLMTDLSTKITKEVAETLGFAGPYAKFFAAATMEIDNYKPFRGYVDTKEVRAGDDVRDDAFYFNRAVAKAYAEHHPDPDIRKAGQDIYFLFNETGDVAIMGLATETATITQLVKRLRQEPFVSSLVKIGQEGMPDMLESYNTAFHEIYSKRSVVERERTATASMNELRAASDAAWDELAEAINALYTVNELVTKDEEKAAALQKVIDDANTYLLRFQKTVNGSASSATDEETPEGPSTETAEEPSTGEPTEEPEEPTTGGEDDDEPVGIPNP